MDEIIVKRPISNIQVVRVGKPGSPGAPGAQGPKGDKGDQGPQGLPGQDGQDGADGVVQSIVAGSNITVDDTDPANPIISASGGGGGSVDSVNGQTGTVVLDADDIDDTSTTHKFATSTQLSNADSATQPGDNISTLTNDSGFTTNTGTVTSVGVSGTDGLEVDSGSPVTSSGTITLGVNASSMRTHLNVANGATANTGTVTSVAVSGSDGIEIDSGSPVTSSGTIALGVNKSSMLSHLNVEDGADVTDATNVSAAGAVMTTGNQTVAGEKTFTSSLTHDNSHPVLGGKAVLSAFGGGIAALYKTSSDAQPGLYFHASNGLSFGAGGSTGTDTTLSRVGANNLSLNSSRLSGVVDPTDPQDAATKKYVDDEIDGLDTRVETLEDLPELTEGTGISLTTIGAATSVGISDVGVDTTQLANKAVTNGKMADMAAMTYKMNDTSSTASPADVTSAESPHGQYAILPSNVVKNSGSPGDANTVQQAGLTLDLGSGTMYEVSFTLFYTSPTAADLYVRPIGSPTDSNAWFDVIGPANNSTTVEHQTRRMRLGDGNVAPVGGLGASFAVVKLSGLVAGGRTIGIGWSQQTANAEDSTLLAGSYVTARRLA